MADLSNRRWDDVPFIGSDEFYYETESGEKFEPDIEELAEHNKNLINISLKKEEWTYLYRYLNWEYELNGYTDTRIGNIIDEIKRQLMIAE